MQETWVRSLDRKDPLEKEMATHSHILAWKIPWTEETGGLLSTGLQRVGNNWATKQQKTSKTEVYYQGFSFNRVFRFLFSEVMLKKRPVHSTAGLIHHEKWRWRSFSHVWLFATPWTVACQAPLPMGILQARILEWVAVSSSKGSSQCRDQTQVSHIAGRFFTIWVTREAQEYWSGYPIPSPGELPSPGIVTLNWGLLHYRQILYQLNYQGSSHACTVMWKSLFIFLKRCLCPNPWILWRCSVTWQNGCCRDNRL